MIGAALAVTLGTAAGWVLVGRLTRRAEGLPRLASGWALGQGLLSLGAGACLLLGLPIEVAWLGPVGVLAVLRRHASPGPTSERRDGVLRGLLGIVAVLAVLTALTTAHLGWDGLAIWGLKAKNVAHTGTVSFEELRHPAALPSHPEYPLHLPLLGGLAGRMDLSSGLELDDRTLPLLAAFDVIAIVALLVAWAERRRQAGRMWVRTWLAAGALVPFVWSEIQAGMADLTVALCLAVSISAAAHWLEEDDPGWAKVAALAGGIGAWTKLEGLVWLLILASVLLCLGGARRRELAGSALLATLVAAPWHLVRTVAGLGTESFSLGMESFARLPAIARTMAVEMTTLATWGLLWPTAALTTLGIGWLAVRRRGGSPVEGEMPAGVLALGLAAIAGFFLATPHDLSWHLATALDRLLLQWWPVALWVIFEGACAWVAEREGRSA